MRRTVIPNTDSHSVAFWLSPLLILISIILFILIFLPKITDMSHRVLLLLLLWFT